MKIDALASNEIHETGESSKMPFGYARIWRSSYQRAFPKRSYLVLVGGPK